MTRVLRFQGVATLAFVSTVAIGVASAQNIDPTLWVTFPRFADGPVALVGARGDVHQWDTWQANGSLLAGVADYGGGTLYPEVDGEVAVTRPWGWLDLAGFGFRYEVWGDLEYELGPMACATLAEPVGACWSVYGSTSWMPLGLLGSHKSEHINAELGVTWTDEPWRAVLGYRHKVYYGLDADMMFGGPILGLWYNFGAKPAMRP